jgi:hypothetical protein
MKKFIFTLILSAFFAQAAFCSNIDVLPTMHSHSNARDRVWVGTFQLVWNDLMDRIAFGNIKFAEGTPEIVNELNKREITTDDINDKNYYKYTGKIVKNTKKTIENAIKKKFGETSDILDKLDLKPNGERYIAYAMLKKDFRFVNAFDKLGKSDFRDTQAEFFGISKYSDDQLKKGVRVLFYNSPDDYAVVLETVDKDEVYLYKTANTKQFNFIYQDMRKKELAYNGNTRMGNKDELKVPNLKFFEEKQFDELTGKRIKGTRMQIEKALETVKFDMNNEGVKLKSEAAITMMKTAVGPRKTEEPRYFYFDNTFVLFLKEKEKRNPYFALRVYDINNYQN